MDLKIELYNLIKGIQGYPRRVASGANEQEQWNVYILYIIVGFFQTKCVFWQIINKSEAFLEYTVCF